MQLMGARFVDLSEGDAALVIEGLAYLQWIRAGLLGFVGLGVAAPTHRLGGAGPQIGEAVAFVLMMWLPAYTLLLAVVWWNLLPRGDVEKNQAVAKRRWLLALLRAAPVLSLVLAWPLAFAIALE